MGCFGGEIILLNRCKWLRTFFQVVTVLSEGKSCCLYRTFVTWKLVLGPTMLPEGLPTRWRRLYDDYGPMRPGLLLRSAVPSPEPPTTLCYRGTTFQISASLLSPARPVVSGLVVLRFQLSAFQRFSISPSVFSPEQLETTIRRLDERCPVVEF